MKKKWDYINDAVKLNLTTDQKKNVADYFLTHDIVLADILAYYAANKVVNNFILNFISYEHAYFAAQNHKKKMQQEKEKIFWQDQNIRNMLSLLASISEHFIFIKGSFLRKEYEKSLGSTLYRYSKDVDIFSLDESRFWELLQKLNECGYRQNEALYVAVKNGKTDFITVHYANDGLRLDLHAVGFPLQLFCNLDIEYMNPHVQLENAVLILLAHSVSHEIITLRDINDLHVINQNAERWNFTYFEKKLQKNKLEHILRLYLQKYKTLYRNVPRIFYNIAKTNKRYVAYQFPLRIKRSDIWHALHRGSWAEVSKIRYMDFYLRSIITKIHALKNKPALYKYFCQKLKLKKYRIYFLLNKTQFFGEQASNDLMTQKFFMLQDGEQYTLSIAGVNYLVKEHLYFDD